MLGIEGWQVTSVKVVGKGLEVGVEREGSGFYCSECGTGNLFWHDRHERRVEDLPWAGRRVVLVFTRYRVDCPVCERVVVEQLPWVEVYHRHTRRFEETVYAWLKDGASVQKVAKAFGLHWETVKEIDKHFMQEEQSGEEWLSGLTHLGVDERSWGKGHRYLTIVSDLVKRRVVFVTEGRDQKALQRFYKKLRWKERKALQAVVMDMWQSYITATQRYAPQAKIVFDKFHVIKHLNEKLDTLRRQLQASLSKEDRLGMKHSRWILLKGKEHLKEREQSRLEQLAQINQPLYQAYLLKEDFREILTPGPLPEKLDALAEWFANAKATHLKPLQTFIEQCGRWFEGLLNYLRTGLTNALAEVLNNKIATIVKVAYGFRDKEYFKMKIIQACAKPTH